MSREYKHELVVLGGILLVIFLIIKVFPLLGKPNQANATLAAGSGVVGAGLGNAYFSEDTTD